VVGVAFKAWMVRRAASLLGTRNGQAVKGRGPEGMCAGGVGRWPQALSQGSCSASR
jgi:hypothetical protein